MHKEQQHNIFVPDTIVANVTPAGRGGVAIIRISGSLTTKIAVKIINKPLVKNVATLASFVDGNGVIDEGLALFFQGPNSFTGEDVLELHCHGSMVVVSMLLQAAIDYGARMAEPGEFSKRAYLNGKIDLIQAESIADLIDSATTNAARAAVKSLQGTFSTKINSLMHKLTELRVFVEAAIDFPDEELELLTQGRVMKIYHELVDDLTKLLEQTKIGNKIRTGIKLVFAGPPNVGKSTLLNALSEQEISIVTNIAGTTRDVMRNQIYINGLAFDCSDTAGFRNTIDVIEQAGMDRAKQEIAKADHLLWIVSGHQQQDLEQLKELLSSIDNADLLVTIIENKCDIANTSPSIVTEQGIDRIIISAKEGFGLDLLQSYLSNHHQQHTYTEDVFIARGRHLSILSSALSSLHQGLLQMEQLTSMDLIAEDLKHASMLLGEITGQVSSDELLGKIFTSFCIGK